MKAEKFNKLTDREKWTVLWKGRTKGKWLCKKCKGVLDDGPLRSSPFHDASRHCGHCNYELTRRTGGGQNDPFGWILEEE